MNSDSDTWLATCPRGMAPLLASELSELGASDVIEQAAAVAFAGPRAVMYRACLWSRLANRVLLPLVNGPARDADELFATLLRVPWQNLFAPGVSIAVSFSGSNPAIRNTRFGAQRSKDAIVEVCRNANAKVPPVSLENPDLRIVVRLQRDVVDVALDMVGESLHRRGYRVSAGEAPLKENLAAALLLRADWPALAARGAALIDPMCGSATILLEAALMAADRAPALERRRFGFMSWTGHDEPQWQAIRADAQGRVDRALEAGLPEIRGYDADPRVIAKAQENIAAAGLQQWVRVSVKTLGEVRKPTHRSLPEGLVICNPPYGERLGSKDSLPQLFRHLGELLHREFTGWQAAILVGERAHGQALGLRSHRQYSFYNGRLPVLLVLLNLNNNRLSDSTSEAHSNAGAAESQSPWPVEQPEMPKSLEDLDEGARMFANRIRKNQRKLSSWIKKNAIECYRLYDADMPEYAVAVDCLGDWLHVAEYRAPSTIDEDAASARLAQVQAALPLATGVAPERIVYKRREKQRGLAQYQARAQERELVSVREGDARLLINLHDYIDTGLFLDHRPLRMQLGREARGKRFLNLFCYTGSATVHAALGGASKTVSVDLSNTYLRRLSQNLAHNGLAETRNILERAEVMQWLRAGDEVFDLILLDPPSFSNSRKIHGSFDVQRDHTGLLQAAMRRLAPEGVLYFSNNRQKFRLDANVSEHYRCEDITNKTLDKDFSRRPGPHQCWRLRHI
ncbi:MAG: bifunctional 23S rRNA (guanine(2069)-N(7))-methyltransferase RlmK/23S rRNA (guanine(2445)-N(2))-methyltransferase RlmL [Congregibacter sp.]